MSSARAKAAPSRGAFLALSLTALGVVYGDIGTSPLYALKECFAGLHSIPATHENVLGVMSLVFWSINFVVSFKYVSFVLRADNRGEGGILALLALISPRSKPLGPRAVLISLGLFGAALLYGDGVITPAISVLGAVEGLSVATPAFTRFVWPIAVVILTLLFYFQREGTADIGRVFGPVMVTWFASIALLGIRGIAMHPSILLAINPAHAIDLFVRDGLQGFLILGSVVLVMTGAEALYADMGHFGRPPIRITWFAVVLPCLLLNYFGQSALLLERPEAVLNPFFSLVPSWGLYPMVAISTGRKLARVVTMRRTVRHAGAADDSRAEDSSRSPRPRPAPRRSASRPADCTRAGRNRCHRGCESRAPGYPRPSCPARPRADRARARRRGGRCRAARFRSGTPASAVRRECTP